MRAALKPIATLPGSHPQLTRVVVGGVILSFIALVAQFGTIKAGPDQAATPPKSILPEVIGVGIRTTDPVSISFPEPMDRASVEASLSVRPAVPSVTLWAPDSRSLTVWPNPRWRTDARYVLTVSGAARTAAGTALGDPKRASFTTQTAPVVTGFHLQFPTDIEAQRLRALPSSQRTNSQVGHVTAATGAVGEVSTGTSIAITFSTAMDRADAASHFVLSPSVDGDLSWDGNTLVFTPASRLTDDARFAVTVVGAHDASGNRLGGDGSFSFTTRQGAQVVSVNPKQGQTGVDPGSIAVWFSGQMDVATTTPAIEVTDLSSKASVGGTVTWNDAGDQLTFKPAAALAKGHQFQVAIADGARDADHNPVAFSWTFTTKAPPAPVVTTSRTPVTGPPPPADLAQYALWQINQARAAYGLGPLRLDAAISAVASAHALDMARYAYFSHTGRDGSTVTTRLRRAGISFSYSGENICYYNGIGAKAMMNWCHKTFMSEPYPGYANHIGNILGQHYTRVGFGIATNGSRMYMVWDFAG